MPPQNADASFDLGRHLVLRARYLHDVTLVDDCGDGGGPGRLVDAIATSQRHLRAWYATAAAEGRLIPLPDFTSGRVAVMRAIAPGLSDALARELALMPPPVSPAERRDLSELRDWLRAERAEAQRLQEQAPRRGAQRLRAVYHAAGRAALLQHLGSADVVGAELEVVKRLLPQRERGRPGHLLLSKAEARRWRDRLRRQGIPFHAIARLLEYLFSDGTGAGPWHGIDETGHLCCADELCKPDPTDPREVCVVCRRDGRRRPDGRPNSISDCQRSDSDHHARGYAPRPPARCARREAMTAEILRPHRKRG